MEFINGYSSTIPAKTLSHHQSFHDQQALLEQDEIKELTHLKDLICTEIKENKLEQAKQFVNEALQIQPSDTTLLRVRVDLSLRLQEPQTALLDAESLISIHPQCYENVLILCKIHEELNDNRKAIHSLLKTFSFKEYNTVEAITYLIRLSGKLYSFEESKFDEIKCDPHSVLCEMGVVAFDQQDYPMCIALLETAHSVESQKSNNEPSYRGQMDDQIVASTETPLLGLRMRTMLTLANAHSALDHRQLAIAAYSDCLAAAVDTQDVHYQIKALVSVATLHLHSGQTHAALLYYERLLALKASLDTDTAATYWTKAVELALFRNMTAAYTSIGNLQTGLDYASKLIHALEQNPKECDPKQMADAFMIAGDLARQLGQLHVALWYQTVYQQWAKKTKDLGRKGHAYGRLGRVYADLGLRGLSGAFMDQFVNCARKIKDSRLQMEAHEARGDALMALSLFEEATSAYEAADKLAVSLQKSTSIRQRITILLKLGNAMKERGDDRLALRHYQIAEMHAEDRHESDLLLAIQIKMADVMQASSQVLQLDTSCDYLQKIVPTLETYIAQHREEGTHCDPGLYQQLARTYQCLQTSLAKTGRINEAVEVADNSRKWSWYRFMAHRPTCTKVNYLPADQASLVSFMSSQIARYGEARVWNFESIKLSLEKQMATILYYSMIDENIVVWILSPKKGIVRQYVAPIREKVAALIRQFYTSDCIQLHTFSEHRALPVKQAAIKTIIWRNKKRSSSLKIDSESVNVPVTIEELQEYLTSLYDALITPVQDILDKIYSAHCKENETDNTAPLPNLIIIPDQDLFRCPFHALLSKRKQNLGDRFSLVVCSSVLLSERTYLNELDHLRLIQDNEQERQMFRTIGQQINQQTNQKAMPDSTTSTTTKIVNPKMISHPQLLHRPHPMTNNKSKVTSSSGSLTKPNVAQENTRYVSTVTSETCTGTSIYRSSLQVPPFRQVADNERMLVIGSPTMPKSLNYLEGAVWRPGITLTKASKELRSIQNITDADIIEGKEATKETFLMEAQTATILHIATWACLEEGLLAWAPNPSRQEPGPPQPSSYLVTPEDLLRLRLTARLVVLSSGWASLTTRPEADKHSTNTHLLPTLLLLAGAESIVTLLWPVPIEVLNLFYFHFYKTLRHGAFVTQAVKTAVDKIRSQPSYSDPRLWSGFTVVGKDAYLDLNFLRHSILDRTVEAAENAVWSSLRTGIVNPAAEVLNTPRLDTSVIDVSQQKYNLQEWVCRLLKNNKLIPSCLPCVCAELEKALTIWKNDHISNPGEVSVESLGEEGIAFLHFLQFSVLPRGPFSDHHFVIYPTRTTLLACALEACNAASVIIRNGLLTEALFNCIPANQDTLSYIIDLLAITKHAADLQLNVTDLSVRVLWQDQRSRAVLNHVGFSQIGLLLHYAKTPDNLTFLNALLQLCLALSSTKSPVLFHRLQMSLLGSTCSAGLSPFSGTVKTTSLPSLEPKVGLGPTAMDPARVVRTGVWMGKVESQAEMTGKMSLVHKKALLETEKVNEIGLETDWSQRQMAVLAKTARKTYYKAAQLGSKVQVKPGGTPSAHRTPLALVPVLETSQAVAKRTAAHSDLKRSVDQIETLYKEKDRQLYLPHLKTGSMTGHTS